MGFRTMVSPTRGQAPYFPSLARQGSVYNPTLDEVQNQLGDVGKPLSSMNLDESLKSVIAVEENHVLHNPPVGSSGNASSSMFPGNLNLSRKTIDDMWSEIVQHEQRNVGGGDGLVQKQSTLAEITLEDFLVRAGAINFANQDITSINPQQLMMADPMVASTEQADWLQYHQMAAVHQQHMAVLGSGLSVAPPVFGNCVDVGYSENQLAMRVPVPMVGTTLSDSQERKRQFSDEMMEKTIERRQKRMIKNRESAARSRARKQAYTNRLEHEVSHLKTTNSMLKKQKELEMLLPLNRTPEPKYQLRRTSSTPF